MVSKTQSPYQHYLLGDKVLILVDSQLFPGCIIGKFIKASTNKITLTVEFEIFQDLVIDIDEKEAHYLIKLVDF